MCNTAGALRAAQKAGILDVVTYISAISYVLWHTHRLILSHISLRGSCWALGALYSGVAGAYTPVAAADHLRKQVQLPYLDSRIFDMLISPPTNKVCHKALFIIGFLIVYSIVPPLGDDPEGRRSPRGNFSGRYLW